MTHLRVKSTDANPNGTACGSWGPGDDVTMHRQRCSCSLCMMPKPLEAHREYVASVAPPAYRKR